ncbi:MAG: 7-carboxy-7-deazaguanine synthase QueE [bacterium]|nr:7-carboxy-7-deazaguanine synthase QueE [bacterium]
MRKANLLEIYLAIQGEGIYVGEKQIFIRFAGCNLRCKTCDTPFSLTIPKVCKIKNDTNFTELPNPLTVHQVVSVVKGINPVCYSISLTGGEPLLQVDYLEKLLPVLKSEGFEIYLDTNGTISKALSTIISWIDIIAMDIKLRSVTGLPYFWKEHKGFLKLANKKEVFVKIVVSNNTLDEEIGEASSLIKSINQDIPLVLQPIAKIGSYDNSPSLQKLLHFRDIAARQIPNIRIIPQIHKIAGWE